MDWTGWLEIFSYLFYLWDSVAHTQQSVGYRYIQLYKNSKARVTDTVIPGMLSGCWSVWLKSSGLESALLTDPYLQQLNFIQFLLSTFKEPIIVSNEQHYISNKEIHLQALDLFCVVFHCVADDSNVIDRTSFAEAITFELQQKK